MALIVCPDCGKHFSDRAPACPECGCPTSEITGVTTSAGTGPILIANNAFQDGRYEEAYHLFAQLYAQNQENPHVCIHLGLSTAARDYFSNGIPSSAKELIVKGLEITKNGCPSHEGFVFQITPYITDIKKVIDDTKVSVIQELHSAVNSTAPMRSAGAMMADALCSPIASANRNLYEDRRTAEANSRILNNAIANKKVITATLDEFRSFVLKTVADMMTQPLDSSDPLYKLLGDFVVSGDDARIYEALSPTATPQENVYGLCYGEEKILLNFQNIYSTILINGKVPKRSFTVPKGHLVLTNYKVTYMPANPEFSFQRSLNDLIRVEVDGPGGMKTFNSLVFPNNISIQISPNPPGSQATYVALLNEELKMPYR